MSTAREQVARVRSRQRGGQARAALVALKPRSENAPTFDDREISHKDPGTWISPERIAAAIERIFNDGPRLTTSIRT